MPDLKSELMKLNNLKFDDSDEVDDQQPRPPARKVSLAERLWYTLRDNPAVNVRQLAEISGVTNQEAANAANKFFVRQLATRTIVDGVWAYSTCVDAYPVVDRVTAVQVMLMARKEKTYQAKPKRTQQRKCEPEIPAPKVATYIDQSVDDILNTMPIAKARALYDALKKIFGG
jgi:hypothetical protein